MPTSQPPDRPQSPSPGDARRPAIPVTTDPEVPPAVTELPSRGTALSDSDYPPRLGPYRVLGRLGAGGMGVVLAAMRDDDTLKKRVAVKLIKRGRDTDEIIRRFQIERQVLSALNHPNIARVIDAGTSTDGRPYFVMEYVEGMPIDRYCDFHRLSIAQRVQLFMKVCGAVHYAHQNLVVHRDIKPHNILVTDDGEPKLLDFGIAKLLNPDMQQIAVFTGWDLRLMTPEYASPEQVSGGSISTASDVYSLGVLLYELLTGLRPYEFKSRIESEVRRVIMEVEPARPSTAVTREQPAGGGIAVPAFDDSTPPTTSTGTLVTRAQQRGTAVSTLRRELADQLDDIVLMAMRKAPRQRYGSAQQLADDLARHLAGESVIAKPENAWQRLRKSVRRHKVAVGVVAGFLLLATVSAVWLGALWREAERERVRADDALRVAEGERQRADQQEEEADFRARFAVALASRINDDVIPEVQLLAGSLEAQSLLADAINDHAKALRMRSNKNDPQLMRELASSVEALASLAFTVRGSSLGDPNKAIALLDESLALRRAIVQRPGAQPADSENLVLALMSRGDVLAHGLNREQDASAAYLEAERVAGALPPESPDQPGEGPSRASRLLAASILSTGDFLRDHDRADEAAVQYERSMVVRRHAADRWPENSDALRDLSIGYSRLGAIAELRTKWAEAISAYQSALEIRLRLLDASPDQGTARRDVMVTREKLANVHNEAGQPALARTLLELALGEARVLSDQSPDNARAAWDLTRMRLLDGKLNMSIGAHAEAERVLGAARAGGLQAADQRFPDYLPLKGVCVDVLEALGRAIAAQGRSADAITVWREALTRAKALAEGAPTNQDYRDAVARIEGLIAGVGPR